MKIYYVNSDKDKLYDTQYHKVYLNGDVEKMLHYAKDFGDSEYTVETNDSVFAGIADEVHDVLAKTKRLSELKMEIDHLNKEKEALEKECSNIVHFIDVTELSMSERILRNIRYSDQG